MIISVLRHLKCQKIFWVTLVGYAISFIHNVQRHRQADRRHYGHTVSTTDHILRSVRSAIEQTELCFSACRCHLQLGVDCLSFSFLALAEAGSYPLGPVGGAVFGDLLLVDR